MTLLKFILTLIVQLLIVITLIAQTNPNHVWVNGYKRKDGTYVKGHYRTAPNHTNVDNFSTKGNVNPYTNEPGWVTPDGHANPWLGSKEHDTQDYIPIEPYYKVYEYKTTNNTGSVKMASTTENRNFEPYINKYWYSMGDQVNVRFTASTTASIAFRLNKGDQVKIIDRSAKEVYIPGYGNDYWYKVEYKGRGGWVFGKLLARANYTTTTLDDWNGYLMSVNKNSVNVRSEPDVSKGKVLFQVGNGQKVEVLAKTTSKYYVNGYGTDYWYYIKTPEQSGWVFGKLIE